MRRRTTSEAVLLSPREAPRVYTRFTALLPDSINVRPQNLVLSSRPWKRGEWTVATEAAALEHWLDSEGIDQCHLVAESGAAAVALVFATTSSHRLRSLTISEPPWIGADFLSVVDIAFRERLHRLVGLPDEDVAAAFFRLMTDGTDPPPRPVDPAFVAILRAVAEEYMRAPLDRLKLASVTVPVLLVVGDSSSHRMSIITAELARLFRRSVVVEVPGAHHFNLWHVGADRIAPVWLDHCQGASALQVTSHHVDWSAELRQS